MSHEQYWSPDHSLHKTQSDLHTHAYTCYNIHKFLYVYDTNRSLNQHSPLTATLEQQLYNYCIIANFLA